MKKLTFAVIALAILATASHAQDELTKVQQARWHVAAELLSGEWTLEQRAFLLRAARRPEPGMEREARRLFDREQFKNIFLKIGDPSAKGDYRAVRNLDTLAAKKLLMRSLPQAAKAAVWRVHFARVMATRELSDEQAAFLVEAAAWIAEPDLSRGEELGRRSHELFGPEGHEILGTIGPFTGMGRLCRDDRAGAETTLTTGSLEMEPIGDCVCNVNGSNWSCYDTCYSSNSCSVVEGCGFMWLFMCNGTCRTTSSN